MWETVTAPTVAPNVAELTPSGMVADAGTISAGSSDISAMDAPPEGAVSLRMTVQRLLSPETGLDGLHASEVKVIGGIITESVKVRGTLFDELPGLTKANPAGAAEEGAPRPVLLGVGATAVPSAGAAALRVTVQVEVPGVTTVVVLHVNELRVIRAGVARERTVVCDELPRAAVTVAD